MRFPRGRVAGAVRGSGALGRAGAGRVASPRVLELQSCLHSKEEVVAVPPAPLLLLEVWVTATSTLASGDGCRLCCASHTGMGLGDQSCSPRLPFLAFCLPEDGACGAT